LNDLGFLFEPFDALEAAFEFLMVDAFFDVTLPVAQHAID
jgi:hypothetical protein